MDHEEDVWYPAMKWILLSEDFYSRESVNEWFSNYNSLVNIISLETLHKSKHYRVWYKKEINDEQA